MLPAIAVEEPLIPVSVFEAQIGIPGHADPIELQALNVKLGGHVFQEEGGTDVVAVVEEPMDGIDLGLGFLLTHVFILGFVFLEICFTSRIASTKCLSAMLGCISYA